MTTMRNLIRIVEAQITKHPEFNDAFWRWFRGSKVVDQRGDPLVVYHGGAEGIEAFNQNAIGRVHGVDSAGFFFSNDPSDTPWGAKTYATKSTGYTGNGNTYAVFLRIERPYTLEQFATDTGYSVDAYIMYGGEPQHPMSVLDEFKDEIVGNARGKGCDGIIFSYDVDSTFVVFSPSQIKSVNNSGIWGEDDDRIHH